MFGLCVLSTCLSPGVPANTAMPAPYPPCPWTAREVQVCPSTSSQPPRPWWSQGLPMPRLPWSPTGKSCDQDIPGRPGVTGPGHRVGSEFWRPLSSRTTPALPSGSWALWLSESLRRTRTFPFRRWALPSSALSSPPPSGRLTKAPADAAWIPVEEAAARS